MKIEPKFKVGDCVEITKNKYGTSDCDGLVGETGTIAHCEFDELNGKPYYVVDFEKIIRRNNGNYLLTHNCGMLKTNTGRWMYEEELTLTKPLELRLIESDPEYEGMFI